MIRQARKNRVDVDAEVKIRLYPRGCAGARSARLIGQLAGSLGPNTRSDKFRRVIAEDSKHEAPLIPARRIKPGLPADIIEKQFLP